MLAIPFFDTAAAIARRKLTGRSIYIADREHLHHCLQHRGFSSRHVLFFVSCFCALTAAGGMISVILKDQTFAILTTALAVTLLVVTRMFGYAEFLLVKKHLAVFASSFLSLRMAQNDHTSMEVRLNGSADWQALWLKLVEAAAENELNALVLDVSAKAGLERYHAHWTRVKTSTESMDLWKTVIPLSLRGSVVGRLHVMGQRSSRPIGKQMILLADLIDDLEAGLPVLLPSMAPYAAAQEFPAPAALRKPRLFRTWAPRFDSVRVSHGFVRISVARLALHFQSAHRHSRQLRTAQASAEMGTWHTKSRRLPHRLRPFPRRSISWHTFMRSGGAKPDVLGDRHRAYLGRHLLHARAPGVRKPCQNTDYQQESRRSPKRCTVPQFWKIRSPIRSL